MRTYGCGACDRGDESVKISTWRVHLNTPGPTAAICTTTYLGGVKLLTDTDCPPNIIYLGNPGLYFLGDSRKPVRLDSRGVSP